MVTFEEQKKLDSQRTMLLKKCENCGHTMPVINVERKICTHCGHWVYKNKQIEFKYKVQEEIRRANDNRSAKKSK